MNQEVSEVVCRVTVSGTELKLVAKNLKLAYPKKKDAATTTMLVSITPWTLEFALAGASAEATAETTANFDCEIPWLHFQQVFDTKQLTKAPVKLEFANGWYAINGMKTRSPNIVLKPNDSPQAPTRLVSETDNSSNSIPRDGFGDATQAPLNYPRLAFYKYLREFGIQPNIVNKEFAKEVRDVDLLLRKAAKLLEPLAVTREELEMLIDTKCRM